MKADIIRVLLIMLLLVSVAAPLVKANDVSTHLAWVDTTSKNLSVDQGEKAQFYITADSFNYQAKLEVGLYERNSDKLVYYFTQVSNLYDFFDWIYTVETKELSGNYIIRSKITGSNVDVEELYLNVVEPVNEDGSDYSEMASLNPRDLGIDRPEYDITVTEGPAIHYEDDVIVDEEPWMNTPPVLNPIGDRELKEGETITFDLNDDVVDPDDQPIKFKIKKAEDECASPFCKMNQAIVGSIINFFVVKLTAGLEFDEVSGVLIFSPDYDFVKTPAVSKIIRLEFSACDEEKCSNWQKVNIIVYDVPLEPESEGEVEEPLPPPESSGEVEELPVIEPESEGEVEEPAVVAADGFGLGITTWEDTPVDFTLIPADGKEANSFVLLQVPVNGHLEGNLPDLTYVPNLDFNGEDFLNYKVTHSDGSYNEVPVEITVLPVEDPVIPVEEPVEKQELKIMFVHPLPEVVKADETILFSVHIVNDGEKDLEDLRVSLIVPELGLKISSRIFDLEEEDDTVKTLALKMPYFANKGNYLVKITAGNDQIRETAYREVIIK